MQQFIFFQIRLQIRLQMWVDNSFVIAVQNKVVVVDGTRVKLQIWDTAGQERFRSVTHAYYRDAHGKFTHLIWSDLHFLFNPYSLCRLALLLLYDVTNKTTYDNIRAWLGEIREYAQEDVVIVLIGEIQLKGFSLDSIKVACSGCATDAAAAVGHLIALRVKTLQLLSLFKHATHTHTYTCRQQGRLQQQRATGEAWGWRATWTWAQCAIHGDIGQDGPQRGAGIHSGRQVRNFYQVWPGSKRQSAN